MAQVLAPDDPRLSWPGAVSLQMTSGRELPNRTARGPSCSAFEGLKEGRNFSRRLRELGVLGK